MFKQRYIEAVKAWEAHQAVCEECFGCKSTDCTVGDELVTVMDHFALDYQDSAEWS